MKIYCGWHMVTVIKVQEPSSQSSWRGFHLQAPLSLLQCTEILNFAINPESVTCWRRTSMKQNVLCFSFQLLGWHTCLIYGRILGPGQDAYPRLEMCQPGLRKIFTLPFMPLWPGCHFLCRKDGSRDLVRMHTQDKKCASRDLENFHSPIHASLAWLPLFMQ